MTRQKAIALSILETLTERTDGTGLPSGHMFAALMGIVGHMEFMNILAALQGAGLVSVSNHYVIATDRARAMLAEVKS